MLLPVTIRHHSYNKVSECLNLVVGLVEDEGINMERVYKGYTIDTMVFVFIRFKNGIFLVRCILTGCKMILTKWCV